jgi:tripeptidyl-peptidase-1
LNLPNDKTELEIVSDPFHERYGQHLSAEDVNELVKPADETLDQVHEWLQDYGIDESQLQYSNARDWISVTLSVKDVERLLDTKYSVFRHTDGTRLVRTPRWSLPQHLHEHIETIQPTNSFFRPKPKRSTLKNVQTTGLDQYMRVNTLDPSSKVTIEQVCNVSAVTPACLRTLYGKYSFSAILYRNSHLLGTIDYVPKSTDKNQVALCNYLGEANNRSDVNLFLQKFRPEAVQEACNFTVTTIAGGSDQQTPLNATQLAAGTDLEGNLDAETIIGITYPTPLFTFNTGGQPPFISDAGTPTDTNEPYLTWVQFILAQNNIPQVISTSYGDDEQTVPLSFATSVCNSFAQLGARGVSLIFSSGDNGVGAAADCKTNDGKNTTTFLPAFPAGCPYVTTVGATKNINPEIVAVDPANGFVGGGGFSNYFARPSYQDAVVPAYITSLDGRFKNLFNASGRGYPDIAAQGFHFLVVWNGTVVSLDGTRYVCGEHLNSNLLKRC